MTVVGVLKPVIAQTSVPCLSERIHKSVQCQTALKGSVPVLCVKAARQLDHLASFAILVLDKPAAAEPVVATAEVRPSPMQQTGQGIFSGHCTRGPRGILLHAKSFLRFTSTQYTTYRGKRQ